MGAQAVCLQMSILKDTQIKAYSGVRLDLKGTYTSGG